MPQNKRLAGVLDTELTTKQVADWLTELIERFSKAAPKGSGERTAKDIVSPLKKRVEEYLAHRKQGDPHRTSTHTDLCEGVRFALNSFRNIINVKSVEGLNIEPYQAVADRRWEEVVNARIEGKHWTFPCCHCGRGGTELIAEKYFCVRCRDVYTAVCRGCDERSDKADMRVVTNEDAAELYYCEECVSGLDTHECTACHVPYLGRENHGHRHSAELKAAGISACRNCAPGYRKLHCGHWWPNGGHRQAVVVDTEDDNRVRETVIEQGQHVCDNCLDRRHRDDALPEFWRQKVPKVNGSLFTEVGSLRTFGVELEFCEVYQMPRMSDDIKNYWTAKEDASLPRGGVEMASTILHGDEGLQRIRELCEYAHAPEGNPKKKWAVDARSGFHLHVGLATDSQEQVAAIAMGYLQTYELWRLFVAPSRTNSCKYCRRNRITPAQLVGYQPREYIQKLTALDDRRVWCNWHSYPARQTVELRVHQGTKVYEKIANWVKAHTRFCDWCASLKNPKKVYERLKDYETKPRELFLIVAQEAWKDRELGMWFRKRAEALHEKGNRLLSHRKLRQKGIDPKAVPTFTNGTLTFKGRRLFVVEYERTIYVIDRENIHDSGGVRFLHPTKDDWIASPSRRFLTREDAERWCIEHADQNQVPVETLADEIARRIARASENRRARPANRVVMPEFAISSGPWTPDPLPATVEVTDEITAGDRQLLDDLDDEDEPEEEEESVADDIF